MNSRTSHGRFGMSHRSRRANPARRRAPVPPAVRTGASAEAHWTPPRVSPILRASDTPSRASQHAAPPSRSPNHVHPLGLRRARRRGVDPRADVTVGGAPARHGDLALLVVRRHHRAQHRALPRSSRAADEQAVPALAQLSYGFRSASSCRVTTSPPQVRAAARRPDAHRPVRFAGTCSTCCSSRWARAPGDRANYATRAMKDRRRRGTSSSGRDGVHLGPEGRAAAARLAQACSSSSCRTCSPCGASRR